MTDRCVVASSATIKVGERDATRVDRKTWPASSHVATIFSQRPASVVRLSALSSWS